ncbi:MAG: addiction module protein [Nitrosomonadales bacterium]|nr:addiction module protein [Nitrosomonadales bacterium]
MNTQLIQQARVLNTDEQIELVEAIWDGIVSRGAAPSLTETQKSELDRRLADHLANPDDVVPWSEVKASALAKIRQ